MSAPPHHAPSGTRPFVFLHVGDLHLREPGDQNATDLNTILEQVAEISPHGLFDFVYLPGDLAENGCADEYKILEAALKRHPKLPVFLIPGDHDRQLGRMDDFQDFHRQVAAMRQGDPATKWDDPVAWTLAQPPTECPKKDLPQQWPPKSIPHYCFIRDFHGVRCLFLDMVSPGYGQKGIGLDFRLGPDQTQWLNEALAKAAATDMPCAVFMHAYPDDLREPYDRLDIGGLFWASKVRLVEMGHTHYNELAHDGRTLYAAARSVGQNEDGSVGYAVAALDGPVTSWRFRALDRKWPFVLITSPADWRVATRPTTWDNTGMNRDPQGRILVRAVVLSDQAPKYVHCRVGTGPWIEMRRGASRCYEVWLPWPEDGRTIQVEAVHPSWNGHGPDHIDTDVIEPVITLPDFRPLPLIPEKPGSDEFRIHAWPLKGVRGDQLGPNRNGRKW